METKLKDLNWWVEWEMDARRCEETLAEELRERASEQNLWAISTEKRLQVLLDISNFEIDATKATQDEAFENLENHVEGLENDNEILEESNSELYSNLRRVKRERNGA